MDRKSGGRPTGSREKNISGGVGNVFKRGSGFGSGAVGNGGGLSGRPGIGSSSGGGNKRSGGMGCGTLLIVLLLLVISLFKGCGSLLQSGTGILPNQTAENAPSNSSQATGSGSQNLFEGLFGSLSQQLQQETAGTLGSAESFGSGWGTGSTGSNGTGSNGSSNLFAGQSTTGGSVTSGGTGSSSAGDNGSGQLDTTADASARERFTTIRNDGTDTVTVMVYMCGTDLESRNGAGTADLSEMAKASLSDHVNVVVYTGGCKKWRNSIVSSSKNQIYQIKNGGLKCLVSDMGSGAMTNPDTLSSFIKWTAKNVPANRYELILWDHGSGSAAGFGYDEKKSSSDSMGLAEIRDALKAGGVKFDFVGFDACLMATLETALMLDDYADYMIASEETEPAAGWYYTDWLTKLSADTAKPTVEIGRQICDDYYKANNKYGTGITLSVTDLAELSATIPARFSSFAKSMAEKLEGDAYAEVSTARKNSKAFGASARVDQIDLVGFSAALGTQEGQQLAEALKKAVKYNITSSDMKRAYGLSIFFPYYQISDVDEVAETYEEIGLDDDYSRCILAAASMQTAGQAAGGGTYSMFSSLFGDMSNLMEAVPSDQSYTGNSSAQNQSLYELFGGGQGYGSYGGGQGYGSYGGSQDYGSYGSGQESYGNGYGSYGLFGPGFGYSGGNSYGIYGRSSADSKGNRAGVSNYAGTMDKETLTQLLNALVSGSYSGIQGLNGENTNYLTPSGIQNAASYVLENRIDPTKLYWSNNAKGQQVLKLSDKEWELIQSVKLNVLYDDGEGYIDLGLDPVYEWDDDLNLIGEYDGTWLAVNSVPCAFYHMDTEDDGTNYTITGYIPAYVNDVRGDLLVVFSSKVPEGQVIGVRRNYAEGETKTEAKTEPLNQGDTIDFVCDYYKYDGTFQANYFLGERIVYDGNLKLANISIGKSANAAYRLTDIYNQNYWTPVMN